MSAEKPRFHSFEENGRQFLADSGGIWEIEPVGRRFLRSSEIPGRQILLLLAQIEALEAERNRLRAEALPVAFADCEALVSAGLLALAEREDERTESAYSAWLAAAREEGKLVSSEAVRSAREEHARHDARAACLREMSLAVSLGQFRTAECNERAIVAAHREAAGFNSSKAGGEARMKALTPAKRKKIATEAARARWAAKKGE